MSEITITENEIVNDAPIVDAVVDTAPDVVTDDKPRRTRTPRTEPRVAPKAELRADTKLAGIMFEIGHLCATRGDAPLELISHGVGLHRTYVAASLAQLMARQYVVRSERGVYQITDAGRSWVDSKRATTVSVAA